MTQSIAESHSEPKIPRCQHIKVNGVQCGSPALRARSFCYFHDRMRTQPRPRGFSSTLDLPPLEDANAIQCALMQVIRAILEDRLDLKKAGLLLYALQTASSNLKHVRFEPRWFRVIRDPLALARLLRPQSQSSESDGEALIRLLAREFGILRAQPDPDAGAPEPVAISP